MTVFACLLVSTTFLQAQNSLTIETETGVAESTASVVLDVTMESDSERHAVSLAIAFDEAVVSLSSVDTAGTAADQADWSEGTICNAVGRSCTSAGGVLWSIIVGLDTGSPPGSFDTAATIPAGTNVVAQLDFDTSGMGPGDSTDVEFQDGLDLFGVPGKNAIVQEGTGVSASNGLGLVNGSITFETPPGEGFRRCDHDGSGLVDITDFLNLLNFLFLGGFPPICEDASDCDNSGLIDISDGVNGLTHLFLGTVDIPPPGTGPECGPDPTTVVPAGGGLPAQDPISLGCDTYPNEAFLPGSACP